MAQLQAKDYAIFSLRYYADRKVLNRLGPTAPQHMERARNHSEFFWKLFCFVTKKNRDEYIKKYWFFVTECLEEELECDHGIIRKCQEGVYIYFIPKEKTDLVNWFERNVGVVPCTRLKRSRSGYHSKPSDSQYWRRKSEELVKEFEQNQFVKENARNVIVEKIEKLNGNSGT